VYVTGGKNAAENRALATRITHGLVNSGQYSAIERADAFLDQVAREMTTQRSGAIDDRQISELGRQAGAQFVCVGEILEVFGDHQVSARIINVVSVEVVASGVAEGALRNINDFAVLSNQVVASMLGVEQSTVTVPPSSRPTQQQAVHSWDDAELSVREDRVTSRSVPPPSPPPSSTANRGNSIAAYVYGGEDLRGNSVEELAVAVVSGLVRSGRYTQPHRGARERMQAGSRGRMLDDRDFCRIGVDAGVQFLVLIDIKRAGRGYSVWARLLDLNSCWVIATAEYAGLVRDDAEIRAAANTLSRELLNRRVGSRRH
jgi:TolB-like protein